MARKHPFGKGAVRLVDTNWLAKKLKSKTIAILDVQPDVHDYIHEHIPGAVYFGEGLCRMSYGRLPTQWVPKGVFQAVARKSGIDNNKQTVVYSGVGPHRGWGDGLEQTMVAYTLARFGHRKVLLLDGGIDKWKKEKKPLSQEFPAIKPTKFKAEFNKEYIVSMAVVKRVKDREDTVLIDARPPAVYAGQGPWPMAGHIPGAVNLPWKSLMDPKNPKLLKSDAQIEKLLKAAGVTRDKTIIISCGTGREATNQFILLKWLLGFPKVKVYEGSFTEWSSYPDNPTVEGPEPY